MATSTHHPDAFSYDVFLSFRGEDTRKNFTDHLYTALKRQGICTFRDDDAMDRGRVLGPELENAIHHSQISIIVFSRNYASSKWCLDEVLTIIKEQERVSSRHEVIPVFYKVDPSDVRNQTGSFQEAFSGYHNIMEAETDHQKKIEWLEKMEEWRVSLRKAANLTGMVLADGHEAEFVGQIVNIVRKKLDYKALYVEENLVGINEHVSKVEAWLQDPSPVAQILLIDGMGGVGKTTVAKCVYNSNYREYDGSCFLLNITETSNQPGGLLRLQCQLLSNILKSEKEETIWNVAEGTTKVTDAICRKKVLLILDDVSTHEQLNALLGRQRFYPGSKVIITTRHKWLLNAFEHHPKGQTIETLSESDSIELFSLYAFNQHQPAEPYIVQSDLIVHHCMCLPLALKVLGSSLRGSTNDVWEDTIRKLKAIPNPEIQKVLQISYETLGDDKDKQLFLHIACFFVGDEKDYIVKLLAQCNLFPVVGIKNLMDRCLLYVDGHGRVTMHQLMKEMGREVVRQESPEDPGRRSRLWDYDDCFNVLQDRAGTKKVEGLMLDMQQIKQAKSSPAIKINNPKKRSFEEFLGSRMHVNEADFKIGALEKMKNLMLLQLNYVTFSGRCKKLPEKLRLLSWHGFSLKAIPVDIPMKKLVVLDMSYSKLKRVWDGFKFIGSLKILNLSYCVELIKTPDFCGLPGLERLILKGCGSLMKVDESITHLEELMLLDLSGCERLRDLPSLPTSLVSLQMSGCSINVAVALQSMGSSSLQPSHLVDVDISNCNLYDDSFPDDWSSLISLEKLNIKGNKITLLPKCIQTLPGILELDASECPQIQSILGLPKSITLLYMQNNSSLKSVQLAENSRAKVYYHGCKELCDVEGRFKRQSIDKVDRKIIQNLGLESITEKGMELGLEVLHEFGIFSTWVSEEQIPLFSFWHQERGTQRISFEVPLDRNIIKGFSMCVVFPPSTEFEFFSIYVHNTTKNLEWEYVVDTEKHKIPKNRNKYVWLSVWRCGSLLKGGDQISIHVYNLFGGLIEVEVIGLKLIDEDKDEEENEEVDAAEDRKEAHHHHDQMSWTDRMNVDISDHAHCNKYRARCSFEDISFWFFSNGHNDCFGPPRDC